MFDTIRDWATDWATDHDMDGLDLLGRDDDELGFDYMELLKGGAGLLSGAGGMLSGGKGGTPDAAALERARLAAEKEAAERSARTWKIIGGITLGVLGIGGIALLARRPA